jgi:hypothetical protein
MVRQLVPCNKTKPFLKLSQKLRHSFLHKIHLFKKFQNISRYGIFHIYLIKYTSFWLDSDSIVVVALKLIVKIKFRHQNRVQRKNWVKWYMFSPETFPDLTIHLGDPGKKIWKKELRRSTGSFRLENIFHGNRYYSSQFLCWTRFWCRNFILTIRFSATTTIESESNQNEVYFMR